MRCVCKRAQNGSVTVITAKDVRTLAKNARTWNEVKKSDKEYALVWRATCSRVATLHSIERRFLSDEKPDHISWWIGGALAAIEALGYQMEDEELGIEQV